ITDDRASGTPRPDGGTWGTSGSASVTVDGADFTAANLTFANSFDEAAHPEITARQAVALLGRADRLAFDNVRFLGNQDTLYLNSPAADVPSRIYLRRCYVEGDVDFIFGRGTAVLDRCRIHSLTRGSATNNGYVTAPSTPISRFYGFVFINSRLKKETPSMAPNSVTLGRPWHPSGRPDAIGSAVFIGVWMDDHVGATGWSPMNSTDAVGRRVENQPGDARFFEFGTTGPGAVSSPTRRVLTSEQAGEYTIVRVLDGWDPRQ
ncbi:MAG TPA: pectinesterase family protein, partial [Longimicrobium sp.]|nr:pectinesterase family protein [Longimicrobium sp.]